jgi:hypothetical protein
MAFLEIAAAALGKGIADEWHRIRKERRSLVQLPPDSSGDSEPPSQGSAVLDLEGGRLKEIGYLRR